MPQHHDSLLGKPLKIATGIIKFEHRMMDKSSPKKYPTNCVHKVAKKADENDNLPQMKVPKQLTSSLTHFPRESQYLAS